jgi:hypothetical protein
MSNRNPDGKWLLSLPEFWVTVVLALAITVMLATLIGCQMPLRSF